MITRKMPQQAMLARFLPSTMMPQQAMLARFLPSTMQQDAEAQETRVDVTWSTGAQVRRYDWWEDSEFIEELSMDPAHVDLSRLNAGAPVLRDHNQTLSSVIGVVEKAWLESGEGRATIRFSPREDVQPLVEDVRAGILRNISVGYQIRAFEKQKGEDNKLPVYRATDWLPMEISLVAIPADAAAQVRSAEALHPVEIRGITMTDQAKETAKQPVAESVEETKTADTSAIERKAAERAAVQERKRIAEIRRFQQISHTSEEACESYIERGLSIQEAKEKMMEEWAKRADSQTIRMDVNAGADESDKRMEAAVDAIMAKAGLVRGEERARAMRGNPFNGYRMLDFARDAAEQAGARIQGMSQMEVVGRAFTQGGSDFPVLLENTMHKALQGAYAKAADTWRRFCRVGSVSDFRAWKRIRTGSLGNLDIVNELGEFTNKTIPDGEAESIQASTRGNIINISRQAIINDDLSYFLGLTNDLGRAAARTIEAAVYAKLTANPNLSDGQALFHSTHGNLVASGSGTGPTVAAIDAARRAMAVQTDISGNDYLDIRPSIAVCPVSLGGEFRVVNAAEYDVDKHAGSASTKNILTPNRVRGLLTDIVDSPRLTGTGWYLFADPAEAPVLEVVFLDGNENPYLEMQDGFTVDGTRYKVRLDFGVGVVDFRGAFFNYGS